MLTEFRQRYYSGRSTTVELVRQGYVVIVIDMFYWGERRMMFAADPEALRTRSRSLTSADINLFHQRCSQNEQLVARSFLTAGATWPGAVLWDDIRTVDYLGRGRKWMQNGSGAWVCRWEVSELFAGGAGPAHSGGGGGGVDDLLSEADETPRHQHGGLLLPRTGAAGSRLPRTWRRWSRRGR